MTCHFRCCPRLFIYNTCRTSDGSDGACLEQGRVYVIMGRSDPDCCVTVCVMFWFACFSVVFFNHEIYMKEETMVSEAHCMSFTCTELLLFNYAKVKTVFYSMAPLNTNQTPSCAPPLQSVAVFLVMRSQRVEKPSSCPIYSILVLLIFW